MRHTTPHRQKETTQEWIRMSCKDPRHGSSVAPRSARTEATRPLVTVRHGSVPPQNGNFGSRAHGAGSRNESACREGGKTRGKREKAARQKLPYIVTSQRGRAGLLHASDDSSGTPLGRVAAS
ncbi:hypothetical protein B0H12DRAFT_1145734 [Mycena haematopus]|nr:hypothetical protein B0H12DRAFT_1145734 [Mycena haematopus]